MNIMLYLVQIIKIDKHNFCISSTVHSDIRCALKKGVGSDVHKRRYRPEPF
jgi:hypothetical protein